MPAKKAKTKRKAKTKKSMTMKKTKANVCEYC